MSDAADALLVAFALIVGASTSVGLGSVLVALLEPTAQGLFAPRVNIASVMGTVALAVVLSCVGSQWFVSPSASIGEA